MPFSADRYLVVRECTQVLNLEGNKTKIMLLKFELILDLHLCVCTFSH